MQAFCFSSPHDIDLRNRQNKPMAKLVEVSAAEKKLLQTKDGA